MTTLSSSPSPSRLTRCFVALRAQRRTAFVAFLTGGDPDWETSATLLKTLPTCGVDVVEIGMPFSDPMADGAAIQEANSRALAAGATMAGTFTLVEAFRAAWPEVPVVLMGYVNSVLHYGITAFMDKARAVGVDGLILVDLPPEEAAEFREPAHDAGLAMISLVAPTTQPPRLQTVLRAAQGFVYYVTVAGTTGQKTALAEQVAQSLAVMRAHTPLPIVAGFGVSTPEHVQALRGQADGIVVGSAIIRRIAANLDSQGKARPDLVNDVADFVRTLAAPLED